MVNLIVLVLRHIAISQQTSHLLCVLLRKQSLSQEGSIGGDLILKRVVDGLNELGLEEGVILRLLFNHLNLLN